MREFESALAQPRPHSTSIPRLVVGFSVILLRLGFPRNPEPLSEITGRPGAEERPSFVALFTGE